MSLIGVDIGTTACKAVAFNERGDALAYGSQEYPLYVESSDRCELDAEEVWRAFCQVVRAVAENAPANDPVEAIGLSVLADGVAPVNRDGSPLTRFVTGHFDRRAAPQADWLARTFGRERLFQLTGMPVHSMYVLPKILWFREHQPEAYERAWKFVGLQELVQMRLGLEPAMDYSLGVRTMVVDIHRRDWAHDLLAACGLDADKFCPLTSSTQVVGRLDGAAAARLGLRPGVSVVAGGFDQACAALGSAVLGGGAAGLSVGTGECATLVFDRCVLSAELLAGNHSCGFHVLDGLYMSFAAVTTAGAVLRWYRDTLGVPEAEQARAEGRDPYEAIIAQTPNRPAQVFVLPYFAGAGNPWLDAAQRGTVFGLTLDTDRAELAKAILDGICYELRLNLGSLKRAGLEVNRLRAVGGGARSERWMQLKADITGVPVEVMAVREAGCLGAAFLAGLGAGLYTSPQDISALSRVKRVFYPDPSARARYDAAYQQYGELRSRVQGLRFPSAYVE